MGTGRAYVAALADLSAVADPEERRRTWRQGVAALAAAAADRNAPLEGLDPQALLDSVRTAMSDGLLADLSFVTPATAAIATFALANGLPPGPERRELGRRVLEQLDAGDADTFVALATALALTSRRPLAGAMKRARVAAIVSAPPSAGTGADALALALLASPELQRSWVDEPATGSLPSRRLAARIIERAAREAVRRHRAGDDGGLGVLARPALREVWARLLADREWLVARHAATARGLVAAIDPDRATELDREVASTGSPSGWRRGAASLAARVEVEPGALARCVAFLDGELPARDPGVVRALLGGLAGVFAVEAEVADDLAVRGIERGGLEAVEALADLRRDLGEVAPRATDAARRWLQRELSTERPDRRDADDGRTALLAALATELTDGATAAGGSLAAHASTARTALRAGRFGEALRAAHAAAESFAEAVEFLERYDDADPVERRHAFRTLRELDHELLSDGTVISLLAGGEEVRAGRSGAVVLAELQARLETVLLAREAAVETGPVAHLTLRLGRLRALVRAVDADAPSDDIGALRTRRLGVVRMLLPRARFEVSPLRRAVWAALTRGFDALLRDEQLELSDLLAGWTTAMEHDEEFAIAREASMVPEVRAVLDAYAAAMQAAAGAADPDDRAAAIAAVAAAAGLPRALGARSSPRTDAMRTSLQRLLRALDVIVRARGQRELGPGVFEQLEASAGVLSDLVVGARRRLGLAVEPPNSPAALHALAVAVERLRRGGTADISTEAAEAVVAASEDQIPVVGRLLGVALGRLARLPIDAPPKETTDRLATADPVEAIDDIGAALPRWLPPSRTIGGFFVVRPLGKGAGGSVFVACRTEERHDPAPEMVALKVPDFDGGAARNLSVGEFETLFREEAGALLALPQHRNIARFITFDAGARPKPILVMEYVPGQTLEQVLDLGDLDVRTAVQLADGIAAGLEAMHAARVAHLDLKPANVILRGEGAAATPVLVDFGLAGRRLRPGCGSPHYGAPEVWSSKPSATEPFAADVYALACLVYEIMTGEVLVPGESLSDVLAAHLGGGAEARARARFQRDRRAASLGDLLGAALHRRPEHRPTIARFRAGLAAVVPELAFHAWPLAPGV